MENKKTTECHFHPPSLLHPQGIVILIEVEMEVTPFRDGVYVSKASRTSLAGAKTSGGHSSAATLEFRELFHEIPGLKKLLSNSSGKRSVVGPTAHDPQLHDAEPTRA